MLGGADNPNGELPSYITGADMKPQQKNIRNKKHHTNTALYPPS